MDRAPIGPASIHCYVSVLHHNCRCSKLYHSRGISPNILIILETIHHILPHLCSLSSLSHVAIQSDLLPCFWWRSSVEECVSCCVFQCLGVSQPGVASSSQPACDYRAKPELYQTVRRWNTSRRNWRDYCDWQDSHNFFFSSPKKLLHNHSTFWLVCAE